MLGAFEYKDFRSLWRLPKTQRPRGKLKVCSKILIFEGALLIIVVILSRRTLATHKTQKMLSHNDLSAILRAANNPAPRTPAEVSESLRTIKALIISLGRQLLNDEQFAEWQKSVMAMLSETSAPTHEDQAASQSQS